MSRPNILMFGDGSWLSSRTDAQHGRFEAFADDHGGEGLVVVELGAGTAIPTIRHLSERLGARGATVVRVNVREPRIPPPHLSIPEGALAALQRIDALLGACP